MYGKIQKSKRNIINELTLCIMAFAVFSLAGCSHKEKEETGTPKVWAEEVQMPAIENEYQTSAGIKADCGNYYEIQDGILKGCGENQYGQLGIGTSDDSVTYHEEPVVIAENVVHVDLSIGGFTIYLNDKNELYGMGKNDSGQLGQSIEGKDRWSHECFVTEPVLIAEDVKYAVGGSNFILILKQDGILYGLGDNANGQLGDGTAKPVRGERYGSGATPFSSELVPIMKKISYIACDSYTAAAIREDGTLFTWGDNSYGEIGNRTKGNGMPTVSTYVVSEPFKLMEKIKEVRFEDYAAYATAFNGDVYVWGKGYTLSPKKIEK